MKNFWHLFPVVFVMLSFVLTACSPVAQGLTQLPEEGQLLVLMLVTAGLTWLLLQVSVLLKIDLSGYASPVAAVLAPIIVTIIERYLQLIPSIFDNLVLSIIHLIVLLVGSIGSFFVFRMAKSPKTFALR